MNNEKTQTSEQIKQTFEDAKKAMEKVAQYLYIMDGDNLPVVEQPSV